MGNYATAQEMFATCHELQKSRYGDDHEQVLRTQRKLFSIYSESTTSFELFTRLPSRPSEAILEGTCDDDEGNDDNDERGNRLERMLSESDDGGSSFDGVLDRMDSDVHLTLR